jgi:hypothetical protein
VTPDIFRLAGDRHLDHFALGLMIIGMKGSGKTSVLYRVLNQAWTRGHASIGIDTGDFMYERAAIRLPKGVPLFRHNVTRKDGLGIHLAKLCDTEPRAITVVDKLVQSDPSGRNEYFVANGKAILLAAIRVLNHFARREWLPGDLCWVATNRRLLIALCEATNGVVFNPLAALGRSTSANDVMGTAQAAILPIVPYAALCDHLELHDPLEVVRERTGVVSLEWADNISPALEKMYAVVMDVCGEEALSARKPKAPIWFNCDEIRSLARMKFLNPVALRGRRAKANLIITVHEIEGMFDRYGPNAATELMNLMGLKVFLRIGGYGTAEYAAKCLGKIELIQTVQQEHGGSSRSVIEKFNVEPSKLMALPYPDVANDNVEAYCVMPDRRGPFSTKFLADTTLPEEPDFGEPCPSEWYTPRPRGERDLERLGMPLSDPILAALGPEPEGQQ